MVAFEWKPLKQRVLGDSNSSPEDLIAMKGNKVYGLFYGSYLTRDKITKSFYVRLRSLAARKQDSAILIWTENLIAGHKFNFNGRDFAVVNFGPRAAPQSNPSSFTVDSDSYTRLKRINVFIGGHSSSLLWLSLMRLIIKTFLSTSLMEKWNDSRIYKAEARKESLQPASVVGEQDKAKNSWAAKKFANRAVWGKLLFRY